ncbi:MAG: HAD family hydrolase [Proteobacteria bacterium]|nr:HAD family hydrolase [Pseudomonadota bacterium]
MRLSRPRAVLFDWDNTLVDSFGAIHLALNHTLEAFGLAPWSYDKACRCVAKSMRDSFPELFGARWREASDVFYASYAARHLEHVRPQPGAAALLEALNAAGVYLGVVSNKNGAYLRREVEHLGWGRSFGRVVGAADAKADKPARAAVDLALEGSGVAAGPDVWLVGDHPIDVECAVASGCLPIVVRGAVETGVEVNLGGSGWRFASCTELVELVRRF